MAGTGRGRGEEPAAAPTLETHEPFMRQALEAARMALHLGEVPIGSALVANDDVVAVGFNQPIHTQDPTAHAEILALRGAAKALGNYRLTGTTLYVTVEPCLMCVGALLTARVSTVVYGTAEPKFGAIASILQIEKLSLNHRFDVVAAVLEEECRKLMVDFFEFRREQA